MSASLEAIGRLPLFSSLNPRELDLLVHHLRIHKLAPFAVLFAEGEVARGCYIVLGGDVEVLKIVGENREERLALLKPGALAGHFSLVDGKPRSATCRAGMGGARVLELGSEEFDLLFRARSPFAYKILDQIAVDLAGRLRAANERVSEARRAHTAEQREAAARSAGQSLFGFQIPSQIHGVDLDAIEIESTTQDQRRGRDRRP